MVKIKQIVDAQPFSSNTDDRQIYRVIGSVDMDGQGTQHAFHDIDPIIFLDEAWMVSTLESPFRPHPHMGLVAVSYILEGAIQPWDNHKGKSPNLNVAGGIYYINAGRGLVHNESAIPRSPHLHWLQLWFNPGIYGESLPLATSQLIPPGQLPEYSMADGVFVRVVIGKTKEGTSPIVSDWPLLYLHIKLSPDAKGEFPLYSENCRGFVYTVKGNDAVVEGQAIHQRQCVEIESDDHMYITIENRGQEAVELILVSGQPHHRPFYKLLGHGGALVGPNPESVRQSMKDYEADPDKFGS